MELFINKGFIKSATTSFDENGLKRVGAKSNVKDPEKEIEGKPLKVYQVIETGVNYYNIKSMLKAHPEFLYSEKISDVIQKAVEEEDFE